MGEAQRVGREEVAWWGAESYPTYEAARAGLDEYLRYDFYGQVVQPRTESARIEFEAAQAEFLQREPNILDRKRRDDERWARRWNRMHMAPWYSQPFWWLVYGHRGAWLTLGVVVVLVVAGCITASLAF